MSSRKNKICLFKNQKLKWEGASDEDEAKLVKFGIGEVVEFAFTAIRSYLNLQRYFVMIKIGFDNQEQYKDIDTYREVMQLKAGFYQEVKLFHEGKEFVRRWPKSISYEECSDEEFTDLQEKVGDVISTDLGIKNKELQEEVIKLAYSHSEVRQNAKKEIRKTSEAS